jgi:hypothetical protein
VGLLKNKFIMELYIFMKKKIVILVFSIFVLTMVSFAYSASNSIDPNIINKIKKDFSSALSGRIIPNIGEQANWAGGILTRVNPNRILYVVNGKEEVMNVNSDVVQLAKKYPEIRDQWINDYKVNLETGTNVTVATVNSPNAISTSGSSNMDGVLSTLHLKEAQNQEIRSQEQATRIAIQTNPEVNNKIDCNSTLSAVLYTQKIIDDCARLINLARTHQMVQSQISTLKTTIESMGHPLVDLNPEGVNFEANFTSIIMYDANPTASSRLLKCLPGMNMVGGIKADGSWLDGIPSMFCIDARPRTASSLVEARKTCAAIIDQRGLNGSVCMNSDWTLAKNKADQMGTQYEWTDGLSKLLTGSDSAPFNNSPGSSFNINGYCLVNSSGVIPATALTDPYPFRCCFKATGSDNPSLNISQCKGSWGECIANSWNCGSQWRTYTSVGTGCPFKNGETKECVGGKFAQRSFHYSGQNAKLYRDQHPQDPTAGGQFVCNCKMPSNLLNGIVDTSSINPANGDCTVGCARDCQGVAAPPKDATVILGLPPTPPCDKFVSPPVASANGTNWCNFTVSDAKVNTTAQVTGSNGGTGNAKCVEIAAAKSEWNYSFLCPNKNSSSGANSTNTSSCQGGMITLPSSPSGSGSCKFEYPQTNSGASAVNSKIQTTGGATGNGTVSCNKGNIVYSYVCNDANTVNCPAGHGPIPSQSGKHDCYCSWNSATAGTTGLSGTCDGGGSIFGDCSNAGEWINKVFTCPDLVQ